jgi:hypothetical protein
LNSRFHAISAVVVKKVVAVVESAISASESITAVVVAKILHSVSVSSSITIICCWSVEPAAAVVVSVSLAAESVAVVVAWVLLLWAVWLPELVVVILARVVLYGDVVAVVLL